MGAPTKPPRRVPPPKDDPLYDLLRDVGAMKNGTLEHRLQVGSGIALLSYPCITGTERDDLSPRELAERAASRIRKVASAIEDDDRREVARVCLALDRDVENLMVKERMAMLPPWISETRYRDLAPDTIATVLRRLRDMPVEARPTPEALVPSDLLGSIRLCAQAVYELDEAMFEVDLDNYLRMLSGIPIVETYIASAALFAHVQCSLLLRQLERELVGAGETFGLPEQVARVETAATSFYSPVLAAELREWLSAQPANEPLLLIRRLRSEWREHDDRWSHAVLHIQLGERPSAWIDSQLYRKAVLDLALALRLLARIEELPVTARLLTPAPADRERLRLKAVLRYAKRMKDEHSRQVIESRVRYALHYAAQIGEGTINCKLPGVAAFASSGYEGARAIQRLVEQHFPESSSPSIVL